LIGLLLLAAPGAQAKVQVVASTTDLEDLVRQVGKDLVEVSVIAKGTQDPHYIEAKPSFMVKTSRADLLVAVGLDLESAWLTSIQQGARNPRIAAGQPGYLEIGPLVEPLEVPDTKLTRAEGDVHPQGNPHVLLDPKRAGDAAVVIAKRLGELDKANAKHYAANAEALRQRLVGKLQEWQARIDKAGIKTVISYHKTLNYFFERFGIKVPITLEPKPGIPPSAAHYLKVVEVAKRDKVRLILVENFFEPTIADRVVKEVPGLRAAVVPVAVGGGKGIDDLESLYEALVTTIAGKK